MSCPDHACCFVIARCTMTAQHEHTGLTPCNNGYHADEVANHIRGQVQRDRRSSVTANIVARISSQTPSMSAPHAASEAAPTSTRADTPEFSHIADHALNQLHEAHAYVMAAELQEGAQSRLLDPIRPAALGLTPVQPSKSPASWNTGPAAKPPSLGDSPKEHLSRLAPSMPTAPSRSNTIDRYSHNPSALNAVGSQGPVMDRDMDYSPGMQQVHFQSYVEPNTFHVAPPATPHPSKGLLNPPQDAGSSNDWGHANGFDALPDEEQHQQVTVTPDPFGCGHSSVPYATHAFVL